ncbi:hypothetical protein SASPL_112360 [Salvia splendens]|uniref:Protein kinase domain-containing protein n=1 Tax=Salvia splendens TaxID=180675 RepID=A0A8X9A573_SALSN|nr:hypothetical protein SASPL_112360 [Salvia splendens]
MGCFSCFGSSKTEVNSSSNGVKEVSKKDSVKEGSAAQTNSNVNRVNSDKPRLRTGNDSKKEMTIPKEPNIAAQIFTFRELAAATKNFRPESLLGEGGFGRVYKGRLESTGQAVAVKQLDRNGLQGNREFLVEVLMLSLLHHPNFVNLIGYCADGDQRLLVYEYMPLGSLEDHLHDFIFCAQYIPLYLILILKWTQARPLFKDRRKFPKMADPLLQGRYPMRGLYQALAVAAMCLQEQAATRPLIGDVVTALTYLASQSYDPNAPGSQSRGGSGTPRHRDVRRNISDADSLEDVGRGGHYGSPSAHKNSPNFRMKDSVGDLNAGAELGRIDTGGGSGRRWGVDEPDRSDSQWGSPASGVRTRETPKNRDLDRERAVAAAKVWGENWREKKRTNGPGDDVV